MSEITRMGAGPYPVTRVAAQANTQESSGKVLPYQTPDVAAQPVVVSQKDVDGKSDVHAEAGERLHAAVAKMNDYVESTQRDLHFSYDDESGETVVKVVDRKTQDVIRQIPDEIFLKISQAIDSYGDIQLINAQA